MGMHVFREINKNVYAFILYSPLVSKPETVFYESTSKTDVIDGVFTRYCINPTTIDCIKGYSFTKDLIMKEMDLKAAFNRRIV